MATPPPGNPSEQAWLQAVRTSMLRGDTRSADVLLAQALMQHPASQELRRMHAGMLKRTGHDAEAEQVLRELLQADPGDAASALTFARVLKSQGRLAAAAEAVRACMTLAGNAGNAGIAIAAIELLADMQRTRDAAAVAEAAIDTTPGDPRLHAYAGMLAIQLGEFTRAHEHYLFALQHDPRAFEWHAAIGLAHTLRYADATHADFELFRTSLQREDLSGLARAELHFALGKAHDDIADYAHAAQHYRAGNAIRKQQVTWPRKAWRRAIQARLATQPLAHAATPDPGFTPIFIVGMPRSGTTLLAELLSQHPQTCNRGELSTLAELTLSPALAGNPDVTALQQGAANYQRTARQDDAPQARWFIDKQPLNFRYLNLALALFPQAKILHCMRTPRDTALSLWMQCFLENVQGYAYDFADIGIALRDERRLMAHWRSLFPTAIRDVHYEALVASPQQVIAAAADWIGLPPEPKAQFSAPIHPISSASLWQARQPVHAHSVGRWRHYATLVPELALIPQD